MIIRMNTEILVILPYKLKYKWIETYEAHPIYALKQPPKTDGIAILTDEHSKWA